MRQLRGGRGGPLRHTWFALSILSVVSGSTARASPIEISRERITNDTNSIVLVDNEDSHKLWVLPPAQGVIAGYASQYAVSQEQCEAIQSNFQNQLEIQQTILALDRQVRNLTQMIATSTDLAKIKEAKGRIQFLKDSMQEQQRDTEEYLAREGATDGGTVSIIYSTRWPENVARIRQLNPTFQVSEIETQNLQVRFVVPHLKGDKFDPRSLPISGGYSILGTSGTGSTPLGRMADRLQASITLTRLGACYMKYFKMFGMDAEPKLELSATYEYKRSFRRTLLATYDYESIYHFLHESGSDGGLFTSSSWARTLDTTWSESALNFHWNQTDPQTQIPVAERLQLERAVKEDLIAGMSRSPASITGSTPPQPATPGQHGATVLAEGLEKTCAEDARCVAGSMALRFLDSVFGSSSTSAEVTKSAKYSGTYNSSSDEARFVASGTIFTAR